MSQQHFWSDVAKIQVRRNLNHPPTQLLISFLSFWIFTLARRLPSCPPCKPNVIFLQIGWPATETNLFQILTPEAWVLISIRLTLLDSISTMAAWPAYCMSHGGFSPNTPLPFRCIVIQVQNSIDQGEWRWAFTHLTTCLVICLGNRKHSLTEDRPSKIPDSVPFRMHILWYPSHRVSSMGGRHRGNPTDMLCSLGQLECENLMEGTLGVRSVVLLVLYHY